MNNDIYLNETTLNLVTDGLRLGQLDVDGTLDDGGSIEIGVTGPINGRRKMNINASDAGAFVSALYKTSSFVGGRLNMDVNIEPVRMYQSDNDVQVELESP